MSVPALPDQLSEDDLRLLYLDWCSTRVAKRFLELSLDEVWVRSNAAAAPSPPSVSPTAGAATLVAHDRIPDYLDLVRRTAVMLAEEMELPGFEDWKIAYLQDPTTFEQEMLRR